MYNALFPMEKVVGGRGLEPRTNGLRGRLPHPLRYPFHSAGMACNPQKRTTDANKVPT
jgi:hypothetical protein